jgi:hypothetical protein
MLGLQRSTRAHPRRPPGGGPRGVDGAPPRCGAGGTGRQAANDFSAGAIVYLGARMRPDCIRRRELR